QFRILANPAAPKHRKIIELADQSSGRDVKTVGADGQEELVAQWVPVDMSNFPNIQQQSPTVARQNKKGEWERLVIVSALDVSGQYLTRASPGHDESGQPDVAFSFNSDGANLFGELTGTHLPDPNSDLKYQLGIVLDGVLKSAPNLHSRI